MNKKFFIAAAVFCAGMFLAADNPEMLKWDFSQPQRDWQKCKDLTVTQQNDALELNIIVIFECFINFQFFLKTVYYFLWR